MKTSAIDSSTKNECATLKMNTVLYHDIFEAAGEEAADNYEAALTACQAFGINHRPHSDKLPLAFPWHRIIPQSIIEAPRAGDDEDLQQIAIDYWQMIDGQVKALELRRVQKQINKNKGVLVV